jgi:hypothetical protein
MDASACHEIYATEWREKFQLAARLQKDGVASDSNEGLAKQKEFKSCEIRKD